MIYRFVAALDWMRGDDVAVGGQDCRRGSACRPAIEYLFAKLMNI